MQRATPDFINQVLKMDEPGASLRQNFFMFDFAWSGEVQHEVFNEDGKPKTKVLWRRLVINPRRKNCLKRIEKKGSGISNF